MKESLYKISKGQLITIWIFSFLFLFFADEELSGDFFKALSFFILFATVFYTIGWRVNKKLKNKDE